MSVQTLTKKLFETTDGSAISRIVKKLMKEANRYRNDVIVVLFEYMKNGNIEHWRSFVVPDVISIIEDGETSYSIYFEEGLLDPVTAYWCVSGLLKTAGLDCYKLLTEFALDESNDLDSRSHAIKCLANDSNQTFVSGLPTDPGHWKQEELPIDQLKKWSTEGFPKGEGFRPPLQHPSLENPVSDIELLASIFENKLAKYRSRDQDLANPSNWLVFANPADIEDIRSKWTLPELYLEFLEKFSPLKVLVSGINLYGASDLIKAQHGYSYNPVKNVVIGNWPLEYVVIADRGADPFVIDLSNIKHGDAPVLTATHGQGEWRFEKHTGKFKTFLSRLSK